MVSGMKTVPGGAGGGQSKGQLVLFSPKAGSQIPLLLQIATPVTFKLTLVVSETEKLKSGVKRTEIIIITVNILKH